MSQDHDARSDQPVTFAHAARDVEQQRHREVGGGVHEYAGGIGGHAATLGHRRNIQVVVAHGGVGDDAQLRPGGIQDLGVDAIGEHAHHGIGTPDRSVEFVDGQGSIVRGNPHVAQTRQGRQGGLG